MTCLRTDRFDPAPAKLFKMGWIGIWLVQLRVLLHGSDPSHTPQRKEGQKYGHE